uniref:Uncharacterized protein n=1 Tax=Rhizophora mucronata TaxID=61149 RepID=A0A2P2R1J0_RHIMU
MSIYPLSLRHDICMLYLCSE